ncbi:hypothetical protein BJX61DRAFT_535112 [Aspergillus egyptiacus]|nr:hypothetical protein BJX61DRAFT_535112 [Aspergillus egyptiacus]
MGLYEGMITWAADIFRGADDLSLRTLLEAILERLKRSPELVCPRLLLDTLTRLAGWTLGSLFGTVSGGSLCSIREAVFMNEVNATTLILIRDQASELGRFLLDLVEPAKGYYDADGGRDDHDDEQLKEGQEGDRHLLYAEFNELDFTRHMNFHAAVCQAQRLVKSVIFLLSMLFRPVVFREINMTAETQVESDRGMGSTWDTNEQQQVSKKEAGVVVVKGKKTSAESPVKVEDEKWLFVNGIAGERFWLRLACDKLRAMFSREILGIFNRGDGVLWDIIECAGQRSAYKRDSEPDINTVVRRQRTLIDSTASTREAQRILHAELKQALLENNQSQYIVMIAHSQGCLLLRHVLEDLIVTATTNMALREKLRKLCVFTFGNPSLHWKTQREHPKVLSGADGSYLSLHVHRTEHFANRQDFVARLGVLSDDRDYGTDEIFVNEDWTGHLFGTQYSLEAGHYENQNPHGQHSWLLACLYGRSMNEAKGEHPYLF